MYFFFLKMTELIARSAEDRTANIWTMLSISLNCEATISDKKYFNAFYFK